MRKLLSAVCCFLAVGAMSAPAFAGFTFTTGTDVAAYGSTPVGSHPYTEIGYSSGYASGTFTGYQTDNAGDLQIAPADLPHYRYDFYVQLTGGAQVGFAPGPVVWEYYYTGTYEIYYDVLGTGSKDPGDISISEGTVSSQGIFRTTALPGMAATMDITSRLTQSPSSGSSVYGDLSYGGNDLIMTTVFSVYVNPSTASGLEAAFQNTFAQPVPEPASLALLAMGLPVLLMGRRRRSVA